MKRRILFVEDNAVLLQLYGLMLEDQVEWEVETLSNGAAALARMAESAFDVIVTDLQMPGMDGVELIREVKKLHPRTSRIILSGLNDQKEIAEALDDTHQFIAKPFTAKTLKATLSRLGGLDAYLQMGALRSLATRLNHLPSFPALYLDIMEELSSDDPSIEKIGGIVAQDAAMTVKMLQIANSAALGLARQIHSPVDAVQCVGTSTVRALALSAHVFSAFEKTEFKDFSITALWERSLQTANLARAILRQETGEETEIEDAYTAGMLLDLGKMMLATNLPEQFQEAVKVARAKQVPLHEAEQEIFAATHAGLGAYLLGLWGLPAGIVESVAFHLSPSHSAHREFGSLGAVHVASVLTHELCGDEPKCVPPPLDPEYSKRCGVADRIPAWRAEAETLLASADS